MDTPIFNALVESAEYGNSDFSFAQPELTPFIAHWANPEAELYIHDGEKWNEVKGVSSVEFTPEPLKRVAPAVPVTVKVCANCGKEVEPRDWLGKPDWIHTSGFWNCGFSTLDTAQVVEEESAPGPSPEAQGPATPERTQEVNDRIYPRTDYWDAQTPKFRENTMAQLAAAERALAERYRARAEKAESLLERVVEYAKKALQPVGARVIEEMLTREG